MSNEATVNALSKAVTAFFPTAQLKIVLDSLKKNNFDEEGGDREAHEAYVIKVLESFKNTFEKMPKTYETEHQKSGEKVAHLHYFVGGCDWWIVEKDSEEEQFQAFGVAKLGHNSPELGYISIAELVTIHAKGAFGLSVSVELDFHWQPTMLKNIPALQGIFDGKDV